MVIFNEKQKDNLKDFGILIPISNSKSRKSMEFLLNNPYFLQHKDKWLITEIKETITEEDLLRVHSQEYVARLFSWELKEEIIKTYELIDEKGQYHRYDPSIATLDFSFLLENILKKVAGTYMCLKTALQNNLTQIPGFCFYFGGGMHHAKFDYGEGFCLVNDLVISIRKLQNENLIKTAWIIDVDAHKGDGTAFLTQNDETIITLSIHMAKGWPLDGNEFSHGILNPSFIPSDIDIPVEEGEDQLYLEKLNAGLEELKSFGLPDIALVVSGSDPYEEDELPSANGLKLDIKQMKERDLLIYQFLKKLNIPQAYVMAGGYGENSWKIYSQFLEHVLTERLAIHI